MPSPSTATGSPIKIGFSYTDWAALKQAGYPVNFRTDDSAQEDAMVNWANAHGGLGGHKIEAVKVKVTTVDPNSVHAACLKLTQQDHVFAVLDNGAFIGSTACITKQNKTLMNGTVPGGDQDYLSQFPNMMSESADLNQSAIDLIGGGASMGFFKIPGKLGILRNGCDPADVWDGPNGIHSLLKQLGITSKDYVEYKDACDYGVTAGQTAAQALLGFKAAGVTKVLAGTGSAMEKTLSAQGEKQGFKPAWLIGDFESTIQNTDLLNSDNINGAYGVSGTVLDYSDSPGAATCNQIFTAAGLPAMKSVDVDLPAAYLCDEVIQLVQIGAIMGTDATPASYTAAAQKAGNLFTAQTYGVTYGDGDMLGADKIALFRYDASKKAWDKQGATVIATHVPQGS